MRVVTTLATLSLLATSSFSFPSEKRTPESGGHSPSPALRRAILDRRQQTFDSAYYPQYGYDITKCQGYSLNGVTQTSSGLMANLTMQGSACNAFGSDISNLILLVEYQSQQRLHVHIYDSAETQWQIPSDIWPRPGCENPDTSSTDLEFNYDSQPFAFWVTRRSSGEVLFDTREAHIPTYSDRVYQNGGYINGTEMPAHPLVFEDQYLQISSALPTGANIYGNGEVIAASGIRRNSSSSLTTMFAADVGDPIDGNEYGTHAMYIDQRSTGTHGVFFLNSHGVDVVQRDGVIEWRVIGGTLDFYFVSGPTPIKVVEQYSAISGTPQQMPDWSFGFQLCRWGYTSLAETRSVVERMRAANIPLEVQYNDIDWMHAYRNFEFDPNFPPDEYKSFIQDLKDNHQHYIPIIDAAYAVPRNDTDVYNSYTRGAELDVWLKNPDGSEYRGRVWPGITVFLDYFSANAQQYWTESLQNFTQTVDFSGLWLDMNEPSSFSEGSTGSDPAEIANVSTPFPLPNTPGNNATTYGFPECYDKALGGLSGNITIGGSYTCDNATELAMVHQTNDFMFTLSKRDSNGIDVVPSPQVNVPAFDIHNSQGVLNAHTVALNATSQNGLQQYHWHNLYGFLEEKAVSNAIKVIHPNKRPFIVGRSTFAGAGTFTAHWLGDNTSLWTYLLRSIQGVLQFQFFQIPMVGADTAGFNGNTDEELANRWHLLSGFFPFFRNHNTKGAISQEPYVWDSVAEAARTVLAARYRLLPYWETLFYDANAYGTPPLRPLFFNFDDPSYYGNSNQFMVGDNIIVTPVLEPNVTSVVGVLPTMGNTQWRNFFTHELVEQTSDVVRLEAPLSTIPVHIRSGSILLLHRDPAYTIYETKQGPYSLLVNLDKTGYATGCAKIDDGVSLPSTGTRQITWEASGNTLKTVTVDGNFQVTQTLAEIIILGVDKAPSSIMANGQQATNVTYDAALQRVIVGSLGADLNAQCTVTWSM